MSLRRSTRLSLASSATTSDAEQLNGAVNGVSRGKNTQAPKSQPAASKKRKTTLVTDPATDSASRIETKSSKPSKKVKNEDETEFAVPQTPTTKRRKAQTARPAFGPPPSTPKPLGVRPLTSSSPVPLPSNMQSEARPAEPHTTNAPLSTPGGSKLVAYPSSPTTPTTPATPVTKARKAQKAQKATVSAAPRSSLPPPTSTTETLLSDACAHLVKVDPKLKVLVDKHHCEIFSPKGLMESVDPFVALSSTIIGQQVSGAAAASIKAKFIALFPSAPNFPTPSDVAACSIEHLRTAGLSQRKAEYIHGLAEKFASGELSARMLITASDDEVMEKLVAVRGLGRWSVEMFACFALKRMNVFSTGDLGIQRGMAAYVGKDVTKLKAKGGKWKYMTEQEMLDVAEKFSPYRSLFMWYMWRIEDVDISVLKN
ncbi:DNA glycosylase [Glonium stellatum]|uniref:DNA glycosylase n=1 Tax=Glonium stellatum TaxID=574774 RepID=A0A8E2FBT3_9PEZI|nr:DNA glycosylase [Glonium stellatum]